MKKVGKSLVFSIFLLFAVALLPSMVTHAATNSSKEKATTISTNKYYTGIVDGDKNENGYNYCAWYKVKLDKAGYFRFDFERATVDGPRWGNAGWHVSVYVNGKFIVNSRAVSAGDGIYVSPNYAYAKGTWVYIRVEDWNIGSDLAYKFRVYNKASSSWESEKNNAGSSADKMTLNKYYYGNFPSGDGLDYYYTKMNKTGYAQVYFGRRSLDGDKYGNVGWKISVIVNGKVVMDPVWISEAGALDTWVSPKFGYKKGQKIVVRIENSGADDGVDYKVKVRNVSSKYWETENNNSKSKADTVKLKKKYSGICMRDNDADWFTYKAGKTGTLKFYAGKASMDTSGWYYFTVYVNNKQVYSGSNNNATMARLATINVRRGQKVSVKVTSNYQSAYALKLQY